MSLTSLMRINQTTKIFRGAMMIILRKKTTNKTKLIGMSLENPNSGLVVRWSKIM